VTTIEDLLSRAPWSLRRWRPTVSCACCGRSVGGDHDPAIYIPGLKVTCIRCASADPVPAIITGQLPDTCNHWPEGQATNEAIMGHHPAVAHVLKGFRYTHLPPELQGVSKRFHDLAHEMAQEMPDSPEVTVTLRHLLDAKNAAVFGFGFAAE
jgi:hypothetical protein